MKDSTKRIADLVLLTSRLDKEFTDAVVTVNRMSLFEIVKRRIQGKPLIERTFLGGGI